MNNVNMGGMNAMGGPVGGGMPMMNNGAGPGGIRPPMPVTGDQRSQLNTYIYEYFLRNGMFDCARSLLNSDQPINTLKDSPGRRNEGADGEDGDSKDDIDSKRPDDLPLPNLPKDAPDSCFLYEWWCLFWDMFNAQRKNVDGRQVSQYVTHTQVRTPLFYEIVRSLFYVAAIAVKTGATSCYASWIKRRIASKLSDEDDGSEWLKHAAE